MVKNQTKIPYFRQWFFDKKAAPNISERLVPASALKVSVATASLR
jgi:hypothetical protein